MKAWINLASAIAAAVSVLLVVACSGGSYDAAPTPVGDSGPGGIEGTVSGLDGKPVAGMRIAIVGGTASFPEIAPETDREGYYRIGGVPPGTFEVAVHDRDGQRIGLASVTVMSGETATLDFSVSARLARSTPRQPRGRVPRMASVFPRSRWRSPWETRGRSRDPSRTLKESRPRSPWERPRCRGPSLSTPSGLQPMPVVEAKRPSSTLPFS